MTLSARVKDTGERISALSFESGHEIRIKYPKGSLISPYPDCDTVVYPRDREGYILHFAHVVQPTTRYDHHPESPEHQHGKKLIAELFRKELVDYDGFTIEFEYPIGSRIADVAVIYPTGWVLVGECQLASITTDELEKRTNDYAKHGCDVIWWLGKNADTSTNRNWCFDKFGSCNLINVSQTNGGIYRAA